MGGTGGRELVVVGMAVGGWLWIGGCGGTGGGWVGGRARARGSRWAVGMAGVAGVKALARGAPRVCGGWVRGLWGLFRKLVNRGNPTQWYVAIPKASPSVGSCATQTGPPVRSAG